MPERSEGGPRSNAPLGQEGLNESFAVVFRKEAEEWVNPRRMARGQPEADAGKIAAANELMGIAFSGGGMRSATFCLGVAQALARRGSLEPEGLLAKADYMATVSGGGYFGTSLTSLCAEPLAYETPDLERFGVSASSFPYGFPGPQHRRGSNKGDNQSDGTTAKGEAAPSAPVHGLESPALRHVRENANFLTHSFGLFDAETWAAASRYLFSLLLTWVFFLLPLPTLVFLATMFIPESAWSRFDPLNSSVLVNGKGTWLALHPWALTAPLWPLGIVLLLGYVQMIFAMEQQESSGLWYRAWEPLKKGILKLQKPLLVLAGVAAAGVLMVFGMWGVHALLSLQGGVKGVLGEALLSVLGLGGLGVAGASVRKLSLPGYARSVLPKVGLAIGGYILLLTLALVWYYFLWTSAFPSSGSPRGESPDLAYKWAFVRLLAGGSAGLVLLTVWRGRWYVNRLSLNFMYEERIQQTWVIAATPPEGPKGRKGKEGPKTPKETDRAWSRVWVRPEMTVGDLIDLLLRERRRRIVKNPFPSSPLPLVVTALNISGSTKGALLDRKSDCFVISPVACGSTVTGWEQTQCLKEFREMRLSMAAAISGAAVSPNMGMATHPTLSVVTTLLNIRLGAWVANPAGRASGLTGLVSAATERFPGLYWKEMLARASHMGPHVYLSDGGHFENLGIYELLRRRCKFIVAVDATGEPQEGKDLNFGGIGIPLRLARTDFGVEVEMNLKPLERNKESGYAGSYFAVGRIRYPRMARDARHGRAGELADQDTGYLVLIKSGVVEGTLSPDILNYLRQVNPRFPYDSTLDQQFDQPQFESYRQLGYIAGRAVTDAGASLDNWMPLAGEITAKSLKWQEVKDLAKEYGPQSLAYRFGAMHLAYEDIVKSLPTTT